VNTIKSVLIPEIQSNEGCFAPITVTAPEGSILNARPPAPVKGRTRTGFHVPAAILAALAQIVPGQVQAHTGLGNLIAANGEYADGSRFNAHLLLGGGLGARINLDGINTLMYPTSSANVPTEMFESQTPLMINRKELIPDSGGRGQHRGGLGQRVEIQLPDDFDGSLTLSLRPQMMTVAPEGFYGGEPGRNGRIQFNGEELSKASEIVRRGSVRMNPGDILVTMEPGGGGFGSPALRSRELQEADLLAGYVSDSVETSNT
jgi:N-methylhydantoinase B/oxoprolinase/acetone carboxylase alpha subunit